MDEVRAKIMDLDLNDILPNRFQPRIKFSEDAIIELSESIKEHGVIQPVVVRPIGDKYEIIAGERRYKASVLAGKDTIPAIITNLNDKDSAEVALIENVQRRDLSAIEEAISYKKILDMGYLTQEQLAIKLGKSQSTVANKVRLLNLCDEVQEALMEEKISERHARSLLKLSSVEKQKIMLDKIINGRLTVRKADEEIDKMNNYITEPIESPKNDLNENAFSPFNPGFVDVEKIESQAQEINQTKAEVDFTSLLKSDVSPQPLMTESYGISSIPTVDPFSRTPEVVIPERSSVIPITPIVEEETQYQSSTPMPTAIPMFGNTVSPMVEETPYSSSVPAASAIPMFENTVAPMTGEPLAVAQEPIVNTMIEDQGKPFSMADLLAPQGTEEIAGLSIPTVDPFSPTPEAVIPETPSFIPIQPITPVPTEEQLASAEVEPQASFEVPSMVPQEPVGPQIMPITPIVEESLPSRFLNQEPIIEETEPAGEEKIIEPIVPNRDVETGNEINTRPAEASPIIITDYSKQYDPILPDKPKQVEKMDFRQIINLIREVNNTIEKCGYTIETEEYNLDDIYQVIFKINKN